jgi:hypothetical protein
MIGCIRAPRMPRGDGWFAWASSNFVKAAKTGNFSAAGSRS